MLSQYQQQYAALSDVTFSENEQGVIFIHVASSLAKAQLCLQGGHVCAFQPQGEEPVLWMSDSALFQQDKAIRGGVPVCWPWFGPHPNGLPQHGFVRNQAWLLESVEQQPDGVITVVMGINENEASRALWPHAFHLQLAVTIGSSLEMALTCRNVGDQVIEVGGALHSYFAVADIGHTRIEGLAGVSFDDKVSGEKGIIQCGDVLIDQEVDRVYLNTESEIFIHDEGQNRVIAVSKQGSRGTVVWNPWVEKAASMGDFDDEGYSQMVCVEAVNCGDDVFSLNPGENHTLTQKISVKH